MAALSAAQFNPFDKALFQRKSEKGKSAKVALIAVAPKLLTV